jgi:ring-1,2-phenylacetyl-CoA epoxidase subunit PaaC
LGQLRLALGADELKLRHRLGEWTGYGPILEEDMALSNIAQDELGHSLMWYTLHEKLTGKSPDTMAFERKWNEFTCCRFVTYPKGDFAYTIIRQYLFDEAEQVRLKALARSTYVPLKETAEKILREEAYHIIHVKSLVERLGDATEESHQRMQAALDAAFPQSLGMFEKLELEDELVRSEVFPGNDIVEAEWRGRVVPVLQSAGLHVDKNSHGDIGERRWVHAEYLKQLVEDLQCVYQTAPGAKW